MSEEQDVNCQQCGQVPTQYIMLDCEHKFCTHCLSQVFLKDDSGVPCLVCNANTLLDPDTINALLTIKKQTQAVVKPFTTEKRQYVQPTIDDAQVKGHPFLEKLNIALERSLDHMRNVQFDKLQFKEKCQSMRQDLLSEFKQLHTHLDSKYEQFLSEISSIEMSFLNQLLDREEEQQLEVQEIQMMKNEVKRVLVESDGVHSDINQFKVVLNSIDSIVQKKQLSITQLGEYKAVQDELQAMTRRCTLFYNDYRDFFSRQQNVSSTQFITQSRLQRAQQQQQYSHVRQITFNSTSFMSEQRSQQSPPRNSFLNPELNRSRKISLAVAQSRLLTSSPLDARTVLKSSIIKGGSHNKSARQLKMAQMLSQFTFQT